MKIKLVYLGLALTIIFPLLVLKNPNIIPPILSDISYHITVAQHFNQAGGVVTWDYWESLPAGRAHFYPPVFHIILAAFLRFGLTPFFLIKFTALFSYFFLLFTAWLVTKKLFGDLPAIIGLLFLAASYGFFSITATAVPASLVIALMLWWFYFYQKGRNFNCLIISVLMFYTHLIFPWIFLAATVIYGLLIKKYKTIIKIWLVAFLFYLPWFFNFLTHLQYFKYLHLNLSQQLGNVQEVFNIFIPAIGFLALTYLWLNRRKDYPEKNNLLFLAILTLVFLPVALVYPSRFFGSGGYVWLAMISAVTINLFGEKNKLLVGLIVIIGIFSQFNVSLENEKNNYSVYPAFYLQNAAEKINHYETFTFFDQINLDFFDQIKSKTTPDQTLLVDTAVFSHYYYTQNSQFIVANFLQAFTGLAAANYRQPEIYNKELFKPLSPEQVDVLVVDLRKTPFWTGEQTAIEKSYADIIAKNFELVAQADVVYAFKNKNSDTYKIIPATPVVSNNLSFLIVIFLFFLAFTPIPLKRDKEIINSLQ